MKKFVLNGRIVSVIVLIIGILGLFLYTKIDSFSMASTNNEVITELSLKKFINYNEEWGTGTLLHYNIKSGIAYNEEGQKVPIQKSSITIKSPQINGSYPESIVVATKSTKATNADSVDNVKYVYDSKSGTIVISTSNVDENGNPISESINENEKDEFEIISNYSESTYDSENKETALDVNISTEYTLFASENNVVESSKDFKAIAGENIGEIASVENKTDEIYNGYMKSNAINGTDYITSFTEETELQIDNKDAQDTITLQEVSENSIYKVSIVNYDDMKAVLGEEGYIEISDKDNNLLATLNKDKTSFAYENDINQLTIKTSNIIKEGIIRITSIKEIKNDIGIVENINTISKITGIKDDNESYEKDKNNNVEIKDSQTEVQVELSQTKWTNKKQNELTMDVILKTDNVKNNLFKNPVIKVELPEEVEKVILGESSIIYGNGIEIKNLVAEKNENEKYELIITLTGAQTQYYENEIGVITDIKIPLNVILKSNIESKTSNLNITYLNEYSVAGTTDKGEIVKDIEIENFIDNNIVEDVQTIKNVNLFSNVPENSTIINENLVLDVVPVKGETTLNDGDTIYEGEFIKYNIKLTNKSNEDINDIKLMASIPEGLTYCVLDADYYNMNGKYDYIYEDETRNKSFEIGTISAGKSITCFYEVRANNIQDDENEKQIESIIQAYIGDSANSNYTHNAVIKKAEGKVLLQCSHDAEKYSWYYVAQVECEGETTVEIKTPEQFELTYVTYVEKGNEAGYIYSEDKYNVNGNIIRMTGPAGYYVFGGSIDASKLKRYDTPNYEVELNAYATININNTTYVSNENRIKIKYEHVSVEMSSENEGEEVRYGDEINYKIVLTNDGGTNLSERYTHIAVNLLDYLPENFHASQVTYETFEEEKENEKYDSDGKLLSYTPTGKFYKTTKTNDFLKYKISEDKSVYKADLIINLPYNESSVVNITGTADYVYEKTKIENKATVSDPLNAENDGEIIAPAVTNTITHYIVPKEMSISSEQIVNPEPDVPQEPVEPSTPSETDNPRRDSDNNTEENKYNISGVAWIDQNTDGQRQVDERLLNNINVELINMQNSEIVQARTTTNNNGYYSFTDLATGNYIVTFNYNKELYKITDYKKANVDSRLNSDVMAKEITVNGNKIVAAVTDIIELNDSVNNIDIGLVEIKDCDFKVEKYISKVTVKTNKGTKEYNYNNANLAKVEIRAKELEGATVVVEYKIVVTNLGESSGKVENIIDSLPDGLKPIQSSNKNWISMANGELSNTSLSNQTINPGESIEYSLVATKTMTESSTGTFINNVEITDIYNIDNNQDKNLSNNKANADLIISVSTGALVMYISVILLVLIIIGILAYFINKHTLSKMPNIGKISMCLIIAVMLASLETISTAKVTTAPETVGVLFTGYDLHSAGSFKINTATNGSGESMGTGVCASEGYVLGNPWNSSTEMANREDYFSRTLMGHASSATPGDPIITGDTVESLSFNMEKVNTNANIIINGDNYIIGPFGFTSDKGSIEYTLEVRDNNSTVINNATICDENGRTLNLNGRTIYK